MFNCCEMYHYLTGLYTAVRYVLTGLLNSMNGVAKAFVLCSVECKQTTWIKVKAQLPHAALAT